MILFDPDTDLLWINVQIKCASLSFIKKIALPIYHQKESTIYKFSKEKQGIGYNLREYKMRHLPRHPVPFIIPFWGVSGGPSRRRRRRHKRCHPALFLQFTPTFHYSLVRKRGQRRIKRERITLKKVFAQGGLGWKYWCCPEKKIFQFSCFLPRTDLKGNWKSKRKRQKWVPDTIFFSLLAETVAWKLARNMNGCGTYTGRKNREGEKESLEPILSGNIGILDSLLMARLYVSFSQTVAKNGA